MNSLKDNKMLLLIGGILILITLVFVWFYREKGMPEEEYSLSPDTFLKNYKVNEVIPIAVNNEYIAKLYLAEYVNLMINDPQAAYDLLEPAYREKAYPKYSDFTKYIKQIENDKFYRAALTKYAVKTQLGRKVINLYDSAGNNFIFLEKTIMDYTVLLDNYTL